MGCASLNTKQVQPLLGQEKQIDNSVRIPQGFIHSLKTHNQNIVNSAKIAMDQKTNLMNSFQYFQLNSPLLWQIAINPEYSTANIDLILDLIEGLLNVLPTYIKSNMTYTLYICQTLAAYAKIVFQFYATDEKKRYLKQNIQTKYLNLITDIEQELQIERENHQLINNLEFELFQIKAAFTLTPTNSKEGEEILTQFLGGALQAAITFTLNDDLIEGLKKGIIYIYNEYQKHQMKRKFEIIYYITGLKYEIIQEIYKNSEINSIVEILNKFYLKIIKDCVDWEIKCCWIKSISEIINHKLSLNPQDFHEEHLQICLKKQHILKIQSDCYVNVNNSKISNDTDANLIFQQVEQLKLLSKIQKVLIQGNQELQGLEDFYKIKAKLQSTDSNLLIDKSTLNNIKLHIKNQSIQQKRITEQIKNKGNNNYLDSLINEQLDQILLLDQELHQLILFKAQLSTMMYQEDVDNAENQIYMIYYLIDVLRMNNSNVGDEILQNQLCDIGISNEYQQSQKGNINIILKLEQKLKSITFGIMTTETIRVKLFNIFSVIALYEKLLNHNIEFLLKLQIQLDQVEDIEYCDYRGLEAIINQLYQIMQKIQSDRTFNTEGIKYPSKIQIQLINQWISLRHTDVKLAKLSQFKSNGKVAQLILKIQKSSGEIMKKLIAGVERVQKNIEDSQMIKDSDDSSNLNQIFELLDEQTLNKYNQQKVEQIKLQAIKFKQYFQSIKVDQKQDSHQKQIFEELQGINNSLTVISDFIIITSNNEKCYLLMLRNLKTLLQTYFDKQIKELNNKSVQFEYEKQNVLFKKIVEIAKKITATQQENRLIINNIQKISDSINQHHLNIRNLQKQGNMYSIYIEEIENEIKVQIEKESEKQYNLKSQIEDLQQLEQLIKSHQFSEYPKELESQIIFILKSIQNHNAPTKLKLFDQFAVQIEDALNNSQWRIRQCIILIFKKCNLICLSHKLWQQIRHFY